jgi:adenylate cyclase
MSENGTGRRMERALAAARRVNRHPSLVEPATRLRAWALGGDDLVDRLSTARGRPSDLAARQLVELRGETPGLLGEVGLTALQAWQRLAETQGRGRGEVDVAVMFTDLVDFSSWMLESGDDVAVDLLRELGEAIEPPIAARHGEVVKRLGDGLMAVFWDASSALTAAIEGHERAAEIELGGYRPRLRTGIHVGRPRRIGGDYFGVDVNVAARIADAARPGEILISERACGALGAGAPPTERRAFSAKGVPAGFAVHAVTPAHAGSPAVDANG